MKIITLLFVLLVTITFDKTRSQRRITNGQNVPGAKRYMAYLVKAPISPQEYDEWICGGVIVSPHFIVTSAACVEDIQYMYAIAGYNKYVPAQKLNDDSCTKVAKKKVVFTCVPKTYELDYNRVSNWSYIDIAVVRVESPYLFDRTTLPYCSWVPDMIEINYDSKHQQAGTDTLVLGWGHKAIWRKVEDSKDYNQELLQFGSTLILDKNICKQSYEKIPEILPAIDKYMICTLGDGNIDADGRQIVRSPPSLDGCNTGVSNDPRCDPNAPGKGYGNFNYYNYMRRKLAVENETKMESFRRNGICQNDHGGPLVTWVGASEILIGIASVFLVSPKDRTCMGPFLYTSTQCNGAFLGCVLTMFDEQDKNSTMLRSLNSSNSNQNSNPNSNPDSNMNSSPKVDMAFGSQQWLDQKKRDDINMRYQMYNMVNRRFCDMPDQERGFEMIKRRISWIHHPDGPAENELLEDLVERPQIPLTVYNAEMQGDML